MFPFVFFLFSTDPVFVGSAYIEESQPIGNPVGDDDKIYFFFSEAGKEFDFFDNTIVSRIARVCKVRHDGHARIPERPLIIFNNLDTITSKQGGTLQCQSTFGNTVRHACADVMEMCHSCKHVFNRFGFPLPESSSSPQHTALPPFSLQCHLPLSFHLPHNVSCTRPSL